MIAYTQENWVVTEVDPNTKKYQHTNSGLNITLKWIPQTSLVEFEVRDGDRFLGANYQYAPNVEIFRDTWIYNGGFNVFLQRQNVSMYG